MICCIRGKSFSIDSFFYFIAQFWWWWKSENVKKKFCREWWKYFNSKKNETKNVAETFWADKMKQHRLKMFTRKVFAVSKRRSNIQSWWKLPALETWIITSQKRYLHIYSPFNFCATGASNDQIVKKLILIFRRPLKVETFFATFRFIEFTCKCKQRKANRFP